MKSGRLITSFREVGGEAWDTSGVVKLKFARADSATAPAAGAGLIQPGMITSPDTTLGATLSPGKGALGVQLSEFPIPEDQVEVLYQEALEMNKKSDHDWISILQSSWVSDVAKRMHETFFEQSGLEPPTVQVWWNPDESSKSRIQRAEIIMSGTPNGHPFWEGGSPS